METADDSTNPPSDSCRPGGAANQVPFDVMSDGKCSESPTSLACDISEYPSSIGQVDRMSLDTAGNLCYCVAHSIYRENNDMKYCDICQSCVQ